MSFQGQIDNILSALAFFPISHGINAYRPNPFLSVGDFRGCRSLRSITASHATQRAWILFCEIAGNWVVFHSVSESPTGCIRPTIFEPTHCRTSRCRLRCRLRVAVVTVLRDGKRKPGVTSGTRPALDRPPGQQDGLQISYGKKYVDGVLALLLLVVASLPQPPTRFPNFAHRRPAELRYRKGHHLDSWSSKHIAARGRKARNTPHGGIIFDIFLGPPSSILFLQS